MNKLISVAALVIILVFSGCASVFEDPDVPETTDTAEVQDASDVAEPVVESTSAVEMESIVESELSGIFLEIKTALENKESLAEVENPGFTLPTDVSAVQIKKYFKLGGVYFALVLQSSLNVPIPMDTSDSFVGILSKSGDQTGWEKFLEIRDRVATDKNNPYYMWSRAGKIYLTVVDQNGAGSGEGISKLFVTDNGRNWEFSACSYFGMDYNNEADGNYFAFSKNLDRQTRQATQGCKNVDLNLVEQN